MEEIKIDVSGRLASLRSAPEIVCDNAGYAVHFFLDNVQDGALYAELTIDRNGGKEIVRVPVVSGIAALPQITGEAYSIEIALRNGDEALTNSVWLSCEESIKSFASTPYVFGFDVYNTVCEMLRRGISAERYQALYDELAYRKDHPAVPSEEDYITAVMDRHRASHMTGTIKLRNGEIVKITDADIAENTAAVTTNALTDDAMLPGGTPSAELRIGLNTDLTETELYGAEISMTVWQEISPVSSYPVPVGTYRITSADDSSVTGVSVTAYDDMDKLSSVPFSALNLAQGIRYAPQELIEIIADAAGIAYEGNVDTGYANSRTDSMLIWAFGVQGATVYTQIPISNVDALDDIQAALDAKYGEGHLTYAGDYTYRSELPDRPDVNTVYKVAYNGMYYEAGGIAGGVETARDLLSCVCALLCAFAYIDHSRKLRIRPLAAEQPVRQYTGDHLLQTKISRQPYRLFLANAETEETDTETGLKKPAVETFRTYWGDGVTIRIKTNPLLAVANEAASVREPGSPVTMRKVLRDVVDRLDPVVFYPFQADIYDDAALELGDWVSFGERRAPISGYQWRYHGQSHIECRGSETIAGELRSQADKEASAIKESVYRDARDAMRATYIQMIKTYRGAQSFKYRKLGYFNYRDFLP